MATTPFRVVTSREIYGADISGLQDAVNRCEHVLTLGTAAVTGHPLTAVSDQASPTLHRRIYEGTIRGWLESPAPVIRRAGVIVPTGEYTLFAAQGAIVFHAQQTAGVVITADFTHVTNVSALTGHPAATAVHGATAAATAERIIVRDVAGRAKVVAPAAADDIARLDTVTAHTARTDNPHAVTAAQVAAVRLAGDTMTGNLVVNARLGINVTPSQPIDVDGSAIRIRQSSTPPFANSTGEVGEIRWDADFVYVCVATNTWRRAALAAW